MDASTIDDCGLVFPHRPVRPHRIAQDDQGGRIRVRLRHPRRDGRVDHQTHCSAVPRGDHADIVRAISEWTRAAAAKLPADPEDDMPARLSAAVSAFGVSPLLEGSDKLGHQFQQWVVGFELSAAFAIARYANPPLR
jgi:hypothetical protein